MHHTSAIDQALATVAATTTLYRYAEAVDSRVEDQIAQLLTPGVLLTRGEVVTEGVEAFLGAYRPFLESEILGSRHVVLNPIVEPVDGDDDHVTLRSCFQATTFSALGTRQIFGRYVDDLTRVEGRWLISHKRNIVEWAVDLPAATALQL